MMDLLTFIAAIVGSIAWPASLLAALFILRKPLSELLPGIRRLKYKDLEVDFGKELEKIEAVMDTVPVSSPKAELPAEVQPEPIPKTRGELLDKLAELSPNAAILESWRNVERTLDFYFQSRGIERPQSGQSILRQLDYDPNFSPQLVSAYQELRLLRNRAAHDRVNLTPEHAKEFSMLADRLTYALIEAAHHERWSRDVMPSHALHRTLNQRRFACWFRVGEGDRSASWGRSSAPAAVAH